MWLAVFKAWWNAEFGDAGCGDARPCRRSDSANRWTVRWRIPCAASECDIGSLVACAWLPDRLRVGHRIQRVPVYSSEEHCGARGDVCVCESGGGAVPGLADSRGGHYFAH